jgi:DNA-directed RNA polymerase specialized sigma24 family protein
LQHVTLDEELDVGPPGRSLEILNLHEAIDRLAALDARGAQVVEMRVFGGLTAEQAAAVLGVSKRTVDTDWSVARMWLARELRSPASSGGRG